MKYTDKRLNLLIKELFFSRIAARVEESFTLKKQSEQLLETDKRAVEIAIEQDEEEAIKYISRRENRSVKEYNNERVPSRTGR